MLDLEAIVTVAVWNKLMKRSGFLVEVRDHQSALAGEEVCRVIELFHDIRDMIRCYQPTLPLLDRPS